MNETALINSILLFEALLQGVFIYFVYYKIIDRKIGTRKWELPLYLLIMAGLNMVFEGKGMLELDAVITIVILFPIGTTVLSLLTKTNWFKSINIHVLAYLINISTGIILIIGIPIELITKNELVLSLYAPLSALIIHIIVLIKLYKSNFDYNKLRLSKAFGIIILAVSGILDCGLMFMDLGGLHGFGVFAVVFLVTLVYGIYCVRRYGRK